MKKTESKRIHKIAVTGKGGTGKSAMTSLMARALSSSGSTKTLLIDADPAMGLSTIMGVTYGKTIEEIRTEIVAAAASGSSERMKQTAVALDYKIFEALVENGKLAFLAMGQPQSAGCFCPANTLLRRSIDEISSGFDVVLVDCEAGFEQISRKVVSSIDTVLILSDLSLRARHAAMSIAEASRKFTRARRIGAVINRVKDGESSAAGIAREIGLELMGWIPEDAQLSECDRTCGSLIDLPEECPSVVAVNSILERVFLP